MYGVDFSIHVTDTHNVETATPSIAAGGKTDSDADSVGKI